MPTKFSIRRLKRHIGVAAAVMTLFSSSVLESTAATQGPIDIRTGKALQTLQRFESERVVNDTRGLADLQSAIYTLQSATDIDAFTAANFTEQRRTIVGGWAQILKAIEQSYDARFDPTDENNLPGNCVMPPRGAAGGCGEDPSRIQDSQLRATYIVAIQNNALKAKRASYYWRLHALDMLAMTTLQTSLDLFRKIAPEGTTDDFPALDAILQNAGISSSRRTKIDAWLYAWARP